MAESRHPSFDDLDAHARQVAPAIAECEAQANQAWAEARANQNRLTLAQNLLAANISADAVVETLDWSDEPNADGTFDIDIAECYVPEAEDFGDLGGTYGAVPAGHYVDDGTVTDWDIFLVPGDDDAAGDVISVEQVYNWLRAQPA